MKTSHMTGNEHFDHWIQQNKHLTHGPMPKDFYELSELLNIAHKAGVDHAIDYVRAIQEA